MSRTLEEELLRLLNRGATPDEIVECFLDNDEKIITPQLAAKLITTRDRLPGKQFQSVEDLKKIPGMTDDLLERLLSLLPALVGRLPDLYPVLLFPVRLETRFIKNSLWIRIYPDQISINAHEPRLTEDERSAGELYWNAVKGDGRKVATEQDHRDAWRRLAQIFGPQRAAWIARATDPGKSAGAVSARPDGLNLKAELEALPYCFVAYAFARTPTKPVICQRGRPIRPGLAMFDPRPPGPHHGNGNRALWISHLEEAKAAGMAIEIPLSSVDRREGFSRVIVVGVRVSTREGESEAGRRSLNELLETHHFSTGLGFVKYLTPTNNTRATKSGHSESREDREESFDCEVTGDSDYRNKRANACRLGKALGLGDGLEALKYVEDAGDTGDSYAEEMNRALWPATGDYFLRYLLPDAVHPAGLANLARHFSRFVRAGGWLPSIRVGDQPYGILPVTSVRKATPQHPFGWKASEKDNGGNLSGAVFDEGLHDTLLRLHARWLEWANDTGRVPRITGTNDPDKELLGILSMEPLSIDYRMRPFVDEKMAEWLMLVMRERLFGKGTPFWNINNAPLHWTKEWVASWKMYRFALASYWRGLTGLPENLLKDAPLLRLFGWWSDRCIEKGLTKHIDETTVESPLEYLMLLSQGKTRKDPRTLLHELLQRSLKLAPASSISAKQVSDSLLSLAAPSMLEFLNDVTSPEVLAGRIKDDPSFGKGPPRAYGIRRKLAEKIIGQRFNNLDDILAVIGIGPDTLHDIIYSFQDKETRPDVDVLFRQSLDLCSHRLDAWISSLATKRLVAMREKSPEGIYLGAYGYVEDLAPDPDGRASEGFLHAPSMDQAAAAAVLHSAFLTHSYGNDEHGHPLPNPFRINLTSERVRVALAILEGIRQGQPVGALLGYQFEKRLTEQDLAGFIDEFRTAFPLVANKNRDLGDGETVEAVAARNVVDGLALLRAEPEKIDELIGLDSRLETEVEHLRGTLDAISDLMLCEGVYHAVRGNYERSSAAMNVLSGDAFPPEIESIATRVPGRWFGQRVCILFPPAKCAQGAPRAEAEPRIASWFAELVPDFATIGCRFQFEWRRVNLNKASVEELASIPGVSVGDVEKILSYREDKGPFQRLDDLEIADLTPAAMDALRRWTLTGNDPTEHQIYERINVNTADADELTMLPGIGGARAQRIMDNRPYEELGELVTKAGLGPSVLDHIRRWIATANEARTTRGSLGLDKVENFEAVDLLYACEHPPRHLDLLNEPSVFPTSEQTEMEQRVTYCVRKEFGLGPEDPVGIYWGRSDRFTHGAVEVLELGRQVLSTLGAGQFLRPDYLCRPHVAEQNAFSDSDVDELRKRVNGIRTNLDTLANELSAIVDSGEGGTAAADIIQCLFDASRYGAPNAIPAGPNESDAGLLQRTKSVCTELKQRSTTCKATLDSIDKATPARQIVGLVQAMRDLLGKSFHVLPTFTPGNLNELKEALGQEGQQRLLCGKDESRIRLWLQQAAVAHPPLRELEDCSIAVELWRQPEGQAATPGVVLKVAQLPYEPNSKWLALDDEERGGAGINDDDEAGRGALSIVAATASSEPVFAAENSPRLAGIQLEQWDEKIPGREITTGVSFHYDGPSTQAPQCLLLAVPAQRRNTEDYWHVDEIAEIVQDTMELAKVRAVDPDAMGDRKGGPLQQNGLGLMFPALMFPVDPKRPGWDQTTSGELTEWIMKL